MDKNLQEHRSALDAIANDYVQELYAMDPSFATSLGIPGHEGEYPDYSPAGLDAADKAAATVLRKINAVAINPADPIDAVTLDAMNERLGLQREIHRAHLDAQALNNIECPAQEIRAIFDLMPQETADDWARISQRLGNLPAALSGYRESLRFAKAHGAVSAQRQVQAVTEQATKYATDGDFFDGLLRAANQKLGQTLPEKLRSSLEHGATAAKKAYYGLASFLTEELLPAAPHDDAVGRETYELASRQFLGTQIDLEETYRWGLEELACIKEAQERTAREIQEGATVGEAVALLEQDPKTTLDGTEALRRWMQELSDTAARELNGVHFDIPEPMQRLECKIAPTQEGGIYYTGPSDDFSRPGRMWWSIPAGETSFNTWHETTTVYHEGVPGHHLQVGLAVYNKNLLNDWRRNACWVSGHGEGWALYAERLMHDLGYLKNPGDRLGMWDAQCLRAARVVFDIGVHLKLKAPEEWGGGTWTPEKGYRFLRENISMSEGQLHFEFTRYLGWPGQAPSYKIGQRIWENLRDEAKQRAGNGFSLKEWHTKALSIGSVGLDTLRRALA